MYRAAGYQPPGGYPSPIYSNPPYHINPMRPTGYGSILSLVSDTAQEEYSMGRVPTGGVRSGPIELETAGYQQGGIPYSIPYRLVSGPIHTPPGGYPIHRIRRQLADDRIG